MKATIKLLGLLIIMTGFVSCESIKSLADVEFDTKLATDLNIDVADQALKSSMAGFVYADSTTLNPTSDPEVKKYVNNIKGYSINSITLEVTQVAAGDVRLMKNSWFEIHDDIDDARWALKEDFVVTMGNTITLGNDDGQWADVQRILGRNAEFTVKSEGQSTVNDITIVLKLLVDARVTANPL